jgi:hypothetical protein
MATRTEMGLPQGSVSTRPLAQVDREIATTLLETKAINFQALGQAIATLGPKSVLMEDDGWIRFCGSDMRIFRWPRPRAGLEDVLVLRDLVRDLPNGR